MIKGAVLFRAAPFFIERLIMGNYITEELLEERLTTAKLTQLCRGLTGAAKTAMLANVIERAESVVNGYAASKYSVPVAANALCEEWALVIAEYELYKRGSSGDIPEKIKESFKDVQSQLRDLSAGKLALPVATTPKTSAGGSIAIRSDAPLYPDSAMSGY